MKRLLFIPFLLIGIVSAFAQSAVLQGGPWKPYRMPMYIGQGTGQPVIGDSGPAGGGPPGVGISELGITAQGTGTPPYVGQGSGIYGTNFCDYDAPTTNPGGYHYLCFSPNTTSGGVTGGQLIYGAAGSASLLPFSICVNGLCYTPGGGVAGIVIGSTNVIGGTNGYALTDNGGVLGQAPLGTFAAQNYATPPPIGGTTPAAGTFTALTATGNTVLDGTLTAGSLSTSGTIAGALCSTSAGLVIYSATTNCFSASATSVTIGTTTVANGASGSVLYQNGASPTGTIGEIATNGSGNVVLTTSAALVTPALGAATATSLTTPTITLGTQQSVQGALVLDNTAGGAFATTLKSSNSASAAWTLTLPPTGGTNLYVLQTDGSGTTSWVAQSGAVCTTTPSALQYDASGALGCTAGWTSDATNIIGTTTAALQWNSDTYLNRGATAGNVAISNGSTNATGLRVYNTVDTVTGPTNYERGVFDWTSNSNVLTIGTQDGGSGSVRNLEVVIGGTNELDYGITTAATWTAASPFTAAGAITGTNIIAGASSLIEFTGRGQLSSTGTGVIQSGAAAGSSPVAQILQAQSGSGTNVAGQNWTIIGSLATGNANSGNIVFQTGGAVGSSGTSAATATTALTLAGVTQAAAFGGQITAASLATSGSIAGSLCATSGGLFIYNSATNCFTSAATITVGTTVIASGTVNGLLYTASGPVLGNLAVVNNAVLSTNGSGVPGESTTLPSGLAATNLTLTTPTLGAATGTSIALGGASLGGGALAVTGASLFNSAVTLGSTLTYGGVTLSAAVTGSGDMVLQTSPALVTPALGVATATSEAIGGCTIGGNAFCVTGTSVFNSAVTLSAALTYGGVTLSNSVTGTGSMALSASPTFTGTLSFGILSPTSLGASPTTITGLTVNNSPVASSDYIPYYSSANGAINKATIAAITSAGVAGVSSLNGLVGGLSITEDGGPTINVSASVTSVQVSLNLSNANTWLAPQTFFTQTIFNPAVTVTSGASATLDDLKVSATTTTVTGTTNITTAAGFNKISIYQPIFTDSSSATVTTAATVYIADAPSCTGSLTCTNKYALNVAAGAVNIGGAATFGSTITSGAHAITATSTTALAVGQNGSTTPAFVVNSNSGTQVNGLSVSGSATTVAVPVATVGSDTNIGLTINGKGSGTILVGNISTGAVTITPATTITGALTASASVAVDTCTISSLAFCAGASTPLTMSTAGLLTIANATDTTSGSTGSVNTAGGIGITKSLYVGGTATWAGSLFVKVRSSGSSTITVSATTDYFFCLDPTSNAIAVDLPATPATGATYLIKDCTGKAATNNITVTPASGNIDGASTLVMSTNYQSLAVTYTGSQWSAN